MRHRVATNDYAQRRAPLARPLEHLLADYHGQETIITKIYTKAKVPINNGTDLLVLKNLVSRNLIL